MRAAIGGFAIVVLACLAATPALATRWVQLSSYDRWFWVDLDAVSQRGGLTYYRQVHSQQAGVSPGVGGAMFESNDPYGESAFDCAARRHYHWNETNSDQVIENDAQPNYVWEDDTATFSADVFNAEIVTICGPSAAPPPPAAPAPAVQPSGAEQDWLAMGKAAGRNDLKSVKAYLARGVNPDAPHPDYEHQLSPLDEAACKGNVPLAALLLKHGANLEATENVGHYTPLMFAANCGQAAMEKFLLQRGAQINAKSKDNWTPLDFAVAGKEEADRKAAQMLLAHGAVSGRGP